MTYRIHLYSELIHNIKIMSLMVSDGSEMIRYNPSSVSIEASNSRGISWSMRYRCSGMGHVRALTKHKGEIILCSDQGIYFSNNSGRAWAKRNSSERNFVDIQDMGNELIATTSDGHIYASSSGGFSWFKRR